METEMLLQKGMFKPIMPRKVSPNESPWEIQLKKKATTTYLSPVVDPFVCVYLLVVSSSPSRLAFLYLSSVAQKIHKPIQSIPMFCSSHFWFLVTFGDEVTKKATTTYLSPVVDPFVCVYLLVVSSSSSRLVFLYLSSVAQKIEQPIQ